MTWEVKIKKTFQRPRTKKIEYAFEIFFMISGENQTYQSVFPVVKNKEKVLF